MEDVCLVVFRIFLVERWERPCSTAVDVNVGASHGGLDVANFIFEPSAALGIWNDFGIDFGGKDSRV